VLISSTQEVLDRLKDYSVAVIRKNGPNSKPYCVYSKDGKRKFGCYSSRKQAQKRLQQIEFFKKQDE